MRRSADLAGHFSRAYGRFESFLVLLPLAVNGLNPSELALPELKTGSAIAMHDEPSN